MSAGTAPLYAGDMGNSGTDANQSIAVDSLGAAYVTGYTDARAVTFPVTAGPDLSYNGGIDDAFVTKVVNSGPTDCLYLPLVVR